MKGVYVGVRLVFGGWDLMGFAEWLESTEEFLVAVPIRGLSAAMEWAEERRVLREMPPQDLDRWVDATAKYLKKSSEYESKTAEAHIRDIVNAATTASHTTTMEQEE